MIVRTAVDDVRAVVSPQYAALRHETSIPLVQSFEYLNREDSVRNVLILDRSVTPYYLDKNYIKPVGQWLERSLPGGPDSSQALMMVLEHQLHASHVLDVNSEVSSFQVKRDTERLTLVFEAKGQRVYRVD